MADVQHASAGNVTDTRTYLKIIRSFKSWKIIKVNIINFLFDFCDFFGTFLTAKREKNRFFFKNAMKFSIFFVIE